jgi:hypothetical protein
MSPYDFDFSVVSGQQQNSGYQSQSWSGMTGEPNAQNLFLTSGSWDSTEASYRALQESYHALKERNAKILVQLQETEQNLAIQK